MADKIVFSGHALARDDIVRMDNQIKLEVIEGKLVVVGRIRLITSSLVLLEEYLTLDSYKKKEKEIIDLLNEGYL